jgi:hypothetical protein
VGISRDKFKTTFVFTGEFGDPNFTGSNSMECIGEETYPDTDDNSATLSVEEYLTGKRGVGFESSSAIYKNAKWTSKHDVIFESYDVHWSNGSAFYNKIGQLEVVFSDDYNSFTAHLEQTDNLRPGESNRSTMVGSKVSDLPDHRSNFIWDKQ